MISWAQRARAFSASEFKTKSSGLWRLQSLCQDRFEDGDFGKGRKLDSLVFTTLASGRPAVHWGEFFEEQISSFWTTFLCYKGDIVQVVHGTPGLQEHNFYLLFFWGTLMYSFQETVQFFGMGDFSPEM